MLSASSRHQQKLRDPRALRGIPGHIYILKNSGLKEGLLHIGLSRRSGWAKALELNRDKNNVIPGRYDCVFEMRAQDSGSALETIYQTLHHARQGRVEQDFFEIDEKSAVHIISRCIEDADKRFQTRFQQEIALRAYWDKDGDASAGQSKAATHAAPSAEDNSQGNAPEKMVREGIFKKALAWLS
jgi:hypothetical protein